jgi:hypothetical protein
MDPYSIGFYASIDYVSKYAQHGLFSDAHYTQRYVLERALGSEPAKRNQPKGVLYEFPSAARHRWAEWVSAATPFGEEARKVQRWLEDSYATEPKTATVSYTTNPAPAPGSPTGSPLPSHTSQERHPYASELDDGPIFSNLEEGGRAIQRCVLNIHLYCLGQLPDPKLSLVQRMANRANQENIKREWSFEHLGNGVRH